MSTITLNIPTLLAIAGLLLVAHIGRRLDKQMDRRRKDVIRTIRKSTKQEPTVDEIREWGRRNNVWIGSPAELIGDLTRMGYVVLTPDNWRLIQQQLERHQQPTVKEWLERAREEDPRGGSGA